MSELSTPLFLYRTLRDRERWGWGKAVRLFKLHYWYSIHLFADLITGRVYFRVVFVLWQPHPLVTVSPSSYNCKCLCDCLHQLFVTVSQCPSRRRHACMRASAMFSSVCVYVLIRLYYRKYCGVIVLCALVSCHWFVCLWQVYNILFKEYNDKRPQGDSHGLLNTPGRALIAP